VEIQFWFISDANAIFAPDANAIYMFEIHVDTNWFFIALRIMAIYAASFVSLEEALSSPNNSQVDLMAVVAHVGPWDC
jgi:hypothetical protein